MNKEAAARYHAKPAALQALINDIRRTQYDDLDRRNLANEADFLIEEKYQAQANKRKSPGVVEAVRKAANAHREAPVDRGPLIEHGPREAADPEVKAKRAEQYRKMRETLDQPPTS
jgi:hypothetical protein